MTVTPIYALHLTARHVTAAASSLYDDGCSGSSPPELARRHYDKSLDLGGAPDKDIEKKLEAK
jgi:hypothetical protein